jgi:hypothetical protein
MEAICYSQIHGVITQDTLYNHRREISKSNIHEYEVHYGRWRLGEQPAVEIEDGKLLKGWLQEEEEEEFLTSPLRAT